jgi:hypothetical protein
LSSSLDVLGSARSRMHPAANPGSGPISVSGQIVRMDSSAVAPQCARHVANAHKPSADR